MANPILSADSYKHSHFKQLPPGTKYTSSYIEARKDDQPKAITQFVGINYFIKEYLSDQMTFSDIDYAEDILSNHGVPFNRAGWERIVDVHDGFLPLEIQALPEGMIVPRGTPLVQVRNTDPDLPWLTSFIETALLRSIWYPSSVATNSSLTKAIIYHSLTKTADDPVAPLPFMLHDFGARGATSGESAGLGGMAHLVNFRGTDTIEGMVTAINYYDANKPAGNSIPASEHFTMTAWGKDREADAYGNMIDQFGSGIFSIVSDSYDLYGAVQSIYGKTLKDKINNMPGKLVVRPDSGNPVTTPVKVLKELWEIFGGTVNSKGYRVLSPKIGVIQGDGMKIESIAALLVHASKEGFSTENLVFGMGGALLQDHRRDDMRFAMKGNAIDFGEGWMDTQKKPSTDPTKASKPGRQVVFRMADGSIAYMREDAWLAIPKRKRPENLLQTVYRNGEILREESFQKIRATAEQELFSFYTRTVVETAISEAAE